MTERKDLCGNCRYFDASRGECRKYAPQPAMSIAMPQGIASWIPPQQTVWPYVKATEWCGEWAAVP